MSARASTAVWTLPSIRIWPALGLAAEPGGEIDDGADGGVVEAVLEADAAERGVALRDADAEAELVAALAPIVAASCDDALAHLDRQLDARARGGSGQGSGSLKKHHACRRR